MVCSTGCVFDGRRSPASLLKCAVEAGKVCTAECRTIKPAITASIISRLRLEWGIQIRLQIRRAVKISYALDGFGMKLY